jgi:hypothetical protein
MLRQPMHTEYINPAGRTAAASMAGGRAYP